MRRILIFFIITVFFQITYGEDTVIDLLNLDSNCIELKNKKKKVLSVCNKSWKKWGVNSVPKQSELVNPNSCQSTFTKKEIANSLSGCAQGVLAWPATIATLPIYGLALASKLDNDNSKDRKYILANGTPGDIKRLFVKDLMRKHCGIAQGDENEYISKKCKKWGHQIKKIDCNPFLEDVRKSRKCIHSAKFRRIHRAEYPLIEEKAKKIIKKQEKKAAQKRHYDSAVK